MTEDVENLKVAERKQGVMSYQEIVDAWHRRPISNRVGSRRLRRRDRASGRASARSCRARSTW